MTTETEFTFYCLTHRDQIVRRAGLPLPSPACPICWERLYYVPNGGTVVPARAEGA